MTVANHSLRPSPAGDASKLETAAKQRVWSQALWREKTARFGLILLVLFAIIAIVGPFLSPNDPNAINPELRLIGRSWHFPLGTDQLGRCILTRLIFGARWSLGAAGLACCITVAIGLGVGAFAGYRLGTPGALVMRAVDVLLGLPSLVLALAIVGMLGPSMPHLLAGIVSIWWARYARIVYGLVVAIRERPFVEAGLALGAGVRQTLMRHILPNVLPTIAVLASLELGELILAISGLSFLGLGPQPPTPEWGAMLNEGRSYFLTAPQLMIFPGMAIALVVIGTNLVGDGVRDLLDPMPVHSLNRR